ncbi:MAG: hypothetical protein BWX48_02263 [Verrucomicrobia bacterium ADurb.Bin006]|nr:MAG: hypothetical protein BWX48_02263 [Verrucomicrobia bacterium ADurb.Bin006]
MLLANNLQVCTPLSASIGQTTIQPTAYTGNMPLLYHDPRHVFTLPWA